MVPPDFLLNTIKSKIADSEVNDLKKVFSPLYNHVTLPTAISFEQIMQKIKATEPINVFNRLSNFEKQPPISFDSIMKRLRALGYFTTKAPAKIISFNVIKKLTAAAAIVFLMIGGYFIFNKLNNGKNDYGAGIAAEKVSTQPIVTNNNNAKIDLPAVDTLSNTVAISKQPLLALKNNVKEQRSYTINSNIKIYKKANNKRTYTNHSEKNVAPKQEMISINGEKFTVLENDYMSTFASFAPDKLPIFLQAENPVKTQIAIDKYSYFNVTEGMGAMMKKMYATKKNGLPTRSARKQKEKLEKWKAADSAYFNQNSIINPLDPRDLGNLILNK